MFTSLVYFFNLNNSQFILSFRMMIAKINKEIKGAKSFPWINKDKKSSHYSLENIK